MSSEHHQNPILSVIVGASGSLFAYVQTNGFIVENALEFVKIIIFGFIGGMVGYAGKLVAEKWHKYLKEKSKDICK
jgi:hypothetical protein